MAIRIPETDTLWFEGAAGCLRESPVAGDFGPGLDVEVQNVSTGDLIQCGRDMLFRVSSILSAFAPSPSFSRHRRNYLPQNDKPAFRRG
jgi:hypothetical protein